MWPRRLKCNIVRQEKCTRFPPQSINFFAFAPTATLGLSSQRVPSHVVQPAAPTMSTTRPVSLPQGDKMADAFMDDPRKVRASRNPLASSIFEKIHVPTICTLLPVPHPPHLHPLLVPTTTTHDHHHHHRFRDSRTPYSPPPPRSTTVPLALLVRCPPHVPRVPTTASSVAPYPSLTDPHPRKPNAPAGCQQLLGRNRRACVDHAD